MRRTRRCLVGGGGAAGEMIMLTRLGGKPFYLNSDLIETIEAFPDTTITLTTGKRVLVSDKLDDVLRRIVEYKRDIFYKYPDERLLDRTVERYDPGRS
jgi:flagellar protein FlbD